MSATLHASGFSLCPFSLSPGDHWAAFVDIDLTLLIGKPHLSIVRPKAQCLNMQLPQTKAQYLSLLEDYFLSHCHSSWPALQGCCRPLLWHFVCWPPSRETGSAPCWGHAFCRKTLPPALHGHSCIFSHPHAVVNWKILWSLVFKILSGGHVTSCCIQGLAHHFGIEHPFSISKEVALHNYKAAQKEYQDFQPKASQLWMEFLHQKLLSPGLLDEDQQAIHHVLTAECSRETLHAIQ